MPLYISDSTPSLFTSSAAPSLGFVDPNAKRGQARNRLSASIDSYQANLYGTAQEIADKFGADKAKDWLEEQRIQNEADAARASQQAVRQGAVENWEDVHGPGDLANYAAGLGIQSAPYLAESLTGGLGARALMGGTRAALTAARTAGKVEEAAALAKTLERGQLAGSVAASYPSSVGDILSNQREQTGGKADLGSAAALGIPYAALNALGLEGAIGGRGLMRSGIEALDKVKGIKGGIARAVVAGGKSAAEEALGETGQELANQAGRIAVDPNATFTDPEALERYKQSAIGGALLGGLGAGALGGWKRTEAPSNLLNPDTAPDDNAGNPSVNVNNPNVPLQDWINQQLNVKQDVSKDIAAKAHAKRQADIVAAMNEPSGRFANDENGIERELTMGEAADMGDPDSKEALTALQADHGDAEAVAAGLKPSKNAKRLDNFNRLVDMKHLGLIDQSQFDQSVEQLNASKYGAVAKVLDLIEKEHTAKQKQQAVSTKASEATQATPNVGEANVSPPVKTPVVSKSSIPSQRVDTAGGVASTGSTPAVGGGVSRAPINTLAPNAEVSLLSNQTSQPTANLTTPVQTPAPVVTEPVVSRKRRVLASALAPVQAFVAPAAAAPQVSTETAPLQAHPGLSAADQVAIAQATGNDTDVKAQQEEDLGQRQEVTEKDRQDTRDAIFRKRFEKSENPARDIEIAQAYLTAQRNAPHKSKSAIKAEIAAQFGIGLSSIEKIGNPDALIRAGQALGIDYATTTDLFDAKTRRQVGLGGTETETGSVQSALTANGITSGETGNLGFGVENDLWKQGNSQVGDSTNALIEAKHNEITALLDTIEAKRKIVEETGVDLSKEIAEDEAKIAPLLKKIEEFHLKKTNLSSEVNRLTQRLIDLQKEASATGKDLSKEIADVNSQLSAANESFNKFKQANKPKEKKKGKKNALQESSTGEMDVQSETEDGRTLGEGNTESEDASEEDRYSENDKDSGWPQALESRSKSFYDAGELSDEFDGVSVAIGQLEDLGIENTLGFVSEWKTINDTSKDAINGEISTAGGRYTITLNEAKLTNSDHAAETVTHEVAHAFDMAPHGGVYSSQPEMSFGLKDGVITPVGEVARELHNLYLTNAKWNEYLEYPFDTTKFPSIKSHVIVEGEAFAQAFSAYANPKNQEMMRRLVPKTAAFLDEVIKHVKSTKPLQLQTQPTSAKSALAFRNRNASTGSKVVVNPNGLRGRGQERLASQSAAQADKNKLFNSAQAEVIGKSVTGAANTAINVVAFTSDVLKRAVTQGLASARELTHIYQQRSALMGKVERQASKVIDLASNIPAAEQGRGPNSANQFLLDSTRLKKWGFQPSWLTQQVPLDSVMKSRWKNLSLESKIWITETLKHGHMMLQQKKNLVTDSANLEFDALIDSAKTDNDLKRVASLQSAKASRLKEYGRIFSLNEGVPYAPLKRYGQYAVVAKSAEYEKAKTAKERAALESNEDHYFVDFAETEADALKMVRELKDSKTYNTVYSRQKESDRHGLFGGTMDALNKLRGALDAELNNTKDAAERASIRKTQEMVTDMFLTSLAENSARKSELRRKGVAGNIDMLRSFSTQARADAHFMAAAKHNTATNLTLNKMRKQLKALAPDAQHEASKTLNEILQRHGESMEYNQHPWTSLINRATSIWMLATSPMYYLQNLTQPFMLSLPVMTERHNYAKVATTLVKSYSEISALFKTAKTDGEINFDKFPADVRDMLKTLADRGRIQISMDAELGRVRLDPEHMVSRVLNKVDRIIRTASEKVEAINRATTAITAYRMELAKTNDAAKALEYADSILERTHGDYTAINAPRAFNTSLGKVALQFRKFQLIQATLLTKLVYNSVKGESAEIKWGARKALAFTLGHTALMAGAVGLPGFAALAFMLKHLARLWQEPEDEPFDLEQELRKMIGDEDTANVLLRGAPNLAGIDLSSKLGMGNVLSIAPYSDINFSRKGFYEIAGGLAFGAPGALGARVFDGLGLVGGGEYQKGIEQLLPNGIANGIKAYREQTEGMSNRNNDTTMSAEDISAFDTAATALGLSTTKKSLQQERGTIKYETEQHFKDRESAIRQEFLEARKNGEDTQEIRSKWKALQDKKHELGFKKSGMDALFKSAQSQNQREKHTLEGIQYNKSNKKYVENLTGFADGGEVSYEADRVVGNPESVAPYGTRWITSPSDPVTAKGSGYFGILPNKFEGGVSSELSADNEKGSYPLISPTLTKAELNGILANKATDEAESKARAWQKVQLQKGQDPFAQKLGLRFPQPTE